MTARKTPLRVAAPDEKAPEPTEPTRPKTITEAADGGTQRELLVAMRSRIAKAVEDLNTPARDLAALTKRLTEVTRDIEAIDARAREDHSADEAEDATFDASAV